MVMGVTCGDVVVGRSRGGGCGMKKEGVSQFVTHVTLNQRANAHACTITLPSKFVVYLICTVL